MAERPASFSKPPNWSPDGQETVFFFGSPPELPNIYVISRKGVADGAVPRQITTDGGLMPKWSPDSSRIAFRELGSVATEGFVSVVSPESGEIERLVKLVDVESVHVTWSEDGRAIYYKAQRPDGTSSLWSVPASGGEPHALVHFDDPTRPSMRREFTSYGGRFYFTLTEYESDIWIMELSP